MTRLSSLYRAHSEACLEREQETALRRAIDGLRRDLVDLAFVLERQGSLEAADLAISVSTRLGEMEDIPDPSG